MEMAMVWGDVALTRELQHFGGAEGEEGAPDDAGADAMAF